MELKHEGLEGDYFPFQRGVIWGYLAVKGVYPSLKQEPPFRVCENQS